MNKIISSEMIETARAIRTCPPPEKRSGENWRRHIEKCFQCRENVNADWEDLAGQLRQFFYKKPDRPEPEKGEIWHINPQKSMWVKDFYISPPAVLVIEVDKNRKAECLVIYPDTYPAGPGDIILDYEETGFFDIIVETWNKITVRTDDLSVKLGAVSPEYLEDIKKHAQNPLHVPEWAFLPLSIKKENDPRNEFRRIEKSIAACFSLKPFETLFEKTAFFFEAMKKILPGMPSDFSAKSITEAVFSYRFPDSMIPAYAHSGNKKLPTDWRIMIIKDERMVRFFPSNAEIETDETIDGRRIIAGRSEVPSDFGVFRLIACLSSDSGMLDAEMADIDDDGYFSAEFDVTEINDAETAQPLFCAIYEEEYRVE